MILPAVREMRVFKMSNQWLDAKKILPTNDTYIQCKCNILYKEIVDCLFINNHFIHEGDDITKWVTHWKS